MKQLLILAAIMGQLLTAWAADRKHYELQFGEFHELKVVDGINVDYTCDPSRAGKIEFEADQSTASSVIFSPGKGKLSISLASRDTVYRNLPTVKVYSSFLSTVKNEGDSTVRVIAPAAGPKLSVKLVGNGRLIVRDVSATEVNANIVSGRGTIVLTGRTETAKLSLTGGAGEIQADEMSAQEVSATVTGTGAIFCHPGKSLSYGGLGTGKVYYRGTPAIKKKFLATVKLISLDQPANEAAEK